MKYYELITKNTLVGQIPLMFNGRKLQSEVAANVVILKVGYNNAVQEMKKELEEIQKGLQKDGYEDRSRAYQEMLEVDKKVEKHNSWKEGDVDSEGKAIEQPKMPSAEELERAEETRKTEKEFLKEVEELNEVYGKAYLKKLQEEVNFTKGLSKDDWKAIYDMIGLEGTIKYQYPNGIEKDIEVSDFIQYVGELINE